MEISPGRDLVLSLAGKRIRGEAFTPQERTFLEAIAALPDYRNPVQVACSNCRSNVIVLMNESDAPPAQTFEREANDRWRCVWCGTSGARAQEVRVY
jgi:hypothetical protein